MVKIEIAKTDEAIRQIIALQAANLKRNVAPENLQSDGFVTAEHTFDQLKHINDDEQAIIATNQNGDVVGYAISMTERSGRVMPIFDDLFDTVKGLEYENNELAKSKIIYVGQLCVDRDYRGQGLVQKLYGAFADKFRGKYDYVITDISGQNPKSLKAHQKAGFVKIKSFYDSFSDSSWDIVLLDLGVWEG